MEEINTNVAKNVIIFVGDGMSLPTVTAGRIYRAQQEARSAGKEVNGEESLLAFEKFPHAGLSKVIICVSSTTKSVLPFYFFKKKPLFKFFIYMFIIKNGISKTCLGLFEIFTNREAT